MVCFIPFWSEDKKNSLIYEKKHQFVSNCNFFETFTDNGLQNSKKQMFEFSLNPPGTEEPSMSVERFIIKIAKKLPIQLVVIIRRALIGKKEIIQFALGAP